MSTVRALTASAPLSLLLGCPFFTPPEPLPEDDGILACGEQWSVDAAEPGTSVPIEASGPTLLRLTWDLSPSTAFPRLETDDGTSAPLRDGSGGGVDVRMPLGVGDSEAELWWVSASGEPISGTVALTCTGSFENCSNLADDDGDGTTDCSDLDCGTDADCLSDQEAYNTQTLGCPGDEATLDTAAVGGLAHQWTRYRIAEGEAPWFLGGAEVLLVLDAEVDEVSITATAPGWACLEGAQSSLVMCDVFEEIDADSTLMLVGPGRWWLEPLGESWTGLGVSWVCTD